MLYNSYKIGGECTPIDQKGAHMSKAKQKLLFISLFLLVLVGLGAQVVYAWFTVYKESEHEGETSSLEIEYKIWFDQNGNSIFEDGIDVDASRYYIGDDTNEAGQPANELSLRLINMSAGDPSAENYIAKLRVQVRVFTNANYYIRVKFANEWFMARHSLSTNVTRYVTINQSNQLLMPYGLNSNWYYDPVTTYTYYQSNISDASITLPVVDKPSLTEFSDSSTITFITKYYVYLDIQFEFVQANRMHAIWDLEEIPHSS